MNDVLKKVKDIQQESCVTITLNTHRSKPDNEKDAILLKNLIKEAEERLYKDYDKRSVWPVMEKLNGIAGRIDHSQNTESLAIFVNRDYAGFTRLPVKVTNRVVIDNTFATRDLVRAIHHETAYYVLVLSRQKARLIEAFNDKAVKEFTGPFPLENKLYTTDRKKMTTSKGQDNLIEEFFNRVDKIVLENIKEHPLPILLATETRNVDHYLKITDRKDLIAGHINRNRDDEEVQHIIPDAWKEMDRIKNDKDAKRTEELEKAVGQGKFLTDYNDIWKAILEGRGRTLFVKKGFYQPARLVNGMIEPAGQDEKDKKDVVDDIIDEMIERNLAYGGDTVFLEGNELDSFNNIALITRY
jgi:hypothetical protein